MKSLIRQLAPPLLLDGYMRLRYGSTKFVGNFSSWAMAKQASDGYDDTAILEGVRETTLKVKRGEACFERDGVIFHEPQPAYPLLTALLDAALANDGQLRVLDFGGALGSTYYQARHYLGSVKKLEWCVVEQPRYVACGLREFQTESLQFFPTIEECAQAAKPQLALFSGVLQYLPEPQAVLGKVAELGIERVVIDRTPFALSERTQLAVQRVPATLGGASYPIWLFSGEELQKALGTSYRCIFNFPALDGRLGRGHNRADFKGSYFVRKS